MERRTYVELASNGGYFSKFEWQPDPFLNFIEEKKQDRMKSV